MLYEVFQTVTSICQRYPAESGKILEQLLAISFDSRRAGFSVESHSTEGVDIGLVRQHERYAVEVKTTQGFEIELQDKDIDGLHRKWITDDYIPVVAALKIEFLQDWVVARAANLGSGWYKVDQLALRSLPHLQSLARQHFPGAVVELGPKVLHPPGGISPLEFLGTVLKSENC